MSGESTAHVDFRRLLARRLTITGSTLRPRTSREKGRLPMRCEPRSGRCSFGAWLSRGFIASFRSQAPRMRTG